MVTSFTYNAIVRKVIDGDTVEFLVDLGLDTWKKLRIRVKDLFCPETDGDEKLQGLAAKGYAEQLLIPNLLVVITTYKKKAIDIKTLDRYVGDIIIGGSDFATIMVEQGYGKRTKD